jgi:adenylate cyclase
MEIDRVRVKGKNKPVTIYQPMGRLDSITDEAEAGVAAFEEVLRHYRQQSWDAAEQALQPLLHEDPENILYALYLERIRAYREEPPGEGWDGVFTHKTK